MPRSQSQPDEEADAIPETGHMAAARPGASSAVQALGLGAAGGGILAAAVAQHQAGLRSKLGAGAVAAGLGKLVIEQPSLKSSLISKAGIDALGATAARPGASSAVQALGLGAAGGGILAAAVAQHQAGLRSKLGAGVLGTAAGQSWIGAQLAANGLNFSRVPLPAYRTAVGELFNVPDHASWSIPFVPSDDDGAYGAIVAAAPEIAAAIDDAASRVATPFWSRRAVRNSIANLVFILVVSLYAGLGLLPAPWGVIASGLLSASGVTPREARRFVRDDEASVSEGS
ncbi:hypothetical protein [Flexivirga sp.]|uniref:hypothetical protein n=1 Tax=Flexivirga sp. TaxID=1962927 RepID=UPI003F7E9857